MRCPVLLPMQKTLCRVSADYRILLRRSSPLTCIMAPIKRRATSPVRPTGPSPAKKQRQTKLEDGLSPIKVERKDSEQSKTALKGPDFDLSRVQTRDRIVQREFYPPEMSNERCAQYINGEIPRPMDVLRDVIASTKQTREKIAVGDCVVHWFKRDLRTIDNRALRAASERAKTKNVPLICMFIVSPQDYQAHLTGAPRVDFDLRTLAVLRHDLDKSNIPLFMTTVESRKDVPTYMLKKCKEWGAKHIFCNIEYEVDELRRETKLLKMCLDNEIDFTPLHDDVIVPPGDLKTGNGKQFSVYSPWYRAWVRHLHDHPLLLKAFERPDANTQDARTRFRQLFDCDVPPTPSNKQLSDEKRQHLLSLWPAGEHEAHARLERFVDERIHKYKDSRNFPAQSGTATLSVHFSAGTLSARTAIRRAQEANSSKKLDAGDNGITTWISEVAWRDFYKHVLAHWPYVCMSKPFKYEYTDIRWEYNDEHFKRWSEGMTGFPIVDAAVRQMNQTAYMHNRCRMIVASFLAKDLLLDWRLGERYFMEHLIDGDFASNNGGWGFSASTGVDPQPYFRIFNPLLQSEKFDEQGEYIRKWVPELKDVTGKAIHDPYGRGAQKQAQQNGYPRPIVDHAARRKMALERYKDGLGRETANVGGGVHN